MSGTNAQLSVLIVEDDRFLQKILATKFAKEGFDVRTASDGEDALQQLIAKKPDFVVLDIIIPKMNGFEVIAEMKTNVALKSIPVVVLSNLGQDEDVTRAKELGALEFLTKADHSINEIVEKVKEAYAKHVSKQKS
jgi:DNA-binding response OmpR family regulator